MAGSETLAKALVGAIFLSAALTAGGQQPSNVAETAPAQTSAEPASPLTRTPADMPPNPPKVTCDGDKLTITAKNATLAAVLNAIRVCTGVHIDVPDSARGERLFAELGPGPVRAVLADFLSSTDFNYVIEASPTNPQKVQAVVLNPRGNDSRADAATAVAGNGNASSNRRAWLETRHTYVQSFTPSQDGSSQEADPAPAEPAPVETAATPASSIPAEAAAASASSTSAEAAAAQAIPTPVEAGPVDSVPAASAVGLPVPSGVAPASTDSGSSPNQGKSTQEMIGDMQRMFEQRKQMVQQQTTTGH